MISKSVRSVTPFALLLLVSLAAASPGHGQSRSSSRAERAASSESRLQSPDVRGRSAGGDSRESSVEIQADSVYRAAREALNDGDYRLAATLFQRVADRFPRSNRAGEALYYRAFALSKAGRSTDLNNALSTLEDLRSDYAADYRRLEASTLRIQICGDLARRGDESCASEVVRTATSTSTSSSTSSSSSTAPSTSSSTRTQSSSTCPREGDDNDDRIAALNALLQMNSDAALPILERVLARRDDCIALRKQATFLVSQKRNDRAADILINTARNDPSREVREQAVFWLGQVNQDRAVEVLTEIVEKSDDTELQKKAVFSLTQVRGDRGQQILRDVAQNNRTAKAVREDAIFWLGQRRNTANGDFLRGLFSRLNDYDLKDKIIFSLSQQGGEENVKWLLEIALDEREEKKIRTQALFWAGQSRSVRMQDLSALYDRIRDREIKESIIFAFSQRRETDAVDKLMSIAKSDADREMRSKAIFWLGQSRDPRVLKFLEELINK